ncbi:MAG: hypothetical protein QM809_05550 [Gordonia sp. (in: high G+C Gram-positive bacteria)]|uniref:hypothetical protein n=1 Tax=Gordonia sp. (in: high G+C Gram-positive bacteria) TaxID=84139 RepID=UPI0039E54068
MRDDGAGIAVAGPAGARPEELAAALRAALGVPVVVTGSGEPPSRNTVGLLAVDLSIAAGRDEEELLAGLSALGGPVGLVGVGAGTDLGWPRRLADARERLDPEQRFPLFAVSMEVLRTGDAERSGLAALASWCADPGDPADSAETAAARESTAQTGAEGRPVGSALSRHPAGEPVRSGSAPADPGRTRAERLSGARAGLAELRARLAAELRAGASELAAAAQTAVDGSGGRRDGPVADWLGEALTVYRDRIDAELRAGLDHLRSTALVGLSAAAPADRADPPDRTGVGALVVPGLERRGRRPAAEDLVLLALGASAGLGIGRMLVVPLVQWAGFGAAATALTVLAGLATAAGIVVVRRQGAARAALRAETAEAIGALRGALEHAVAAALGAADARLARELWNRTAPSCVQPSREGVKA